MRCLTIPKLAEERLKRFWVKVNKSEDCWEWTAWTARDLEKKNF